MTDKEKDKYRSEAKKIWKEDLKKRRSEGERIGIETAIGNRNLVLYMSCIALYHKFEDIMKMVEIDFKGWNGSL